MLQATAKSVNDTLDSLQNCLADELTGLLFVAASRTYDQVHEPGLEKGADSLAAKSRIVRNGFDELLDALVDITQKYATELIAIAIANPQILRIEDPALGIKVWLEGRLTDCLQLEINPDKRATTYRDCFLAQRLLRGELLDRFCPEESAAIIERAKRETSTLSRIGSWLRRVVDGWPQPDLGDPDEPRGSLQETWTAPLWCEEEFVIRRMLKRGTAVGYLTLVQSQRCVRTLELRCAGRLQRILQVEEYRARISLASGRVTPVGRDADTQTTITNEPTARVGSPVGDSQSTQDTNPPISAGVSRALLVERVRREIVTLSGQLELGEDYDEKIRGAKGPFSDFITVKVCDRHSDLCDALCAIMTTAKPKIVKLATKIAARSNENGKPILPNTYLSAHKRYGADARRLLDARPGPHPA